MNLIASTALILVCLSQEEARVEPGTSSFEFDGLIEAYRVVQLSPPVDGLLETVTVDRGDFVRKGQVVATLESSVEEATLNITRARAGLEGDLNKQKANLDYNILKSSHDEKLGEKGILSREELNMSRTELLLSKASYQQAQENLRLASLEKLRAEAALKLRIIHSPVDGVVVERHLSPGELVTRQYQSKILGIAQIDPLRIEVILPVSMFGKISRGVKAQVQTELHPGELLEANVKSVDRTVDPASSTFMTHLELENPDNRVPAGLKCRVRFDLDSRH